jgi:uncharacterized protein with HEPN domain
MLSKKAHLALLDIRDCILLAGKFTKGLSYEAFKESRLHFFAVTRALELVSEASRRLPDSFREKHSALPWRAIRDAGNLYRHSYDNVVEAIVWQTLQEDLAPLLAVVQAELDAHEAGQ